MQFIKDRKTGTFNPIQLLVENKKLLKDDFLSGLTVALALIPESIAFAFVAGVSPILSLQTAVMIGFVAAIFSGRPGMISSSTAAISVVFASLIAVHGLEYLFATVVLMGILQILIGVLKLGKYARIIPYPVMLGFLNGLSIVIFLSQWDLFKVNQTSVVNGSEVMQSVWLPGPQIALMLFFVVLTMLIIHFVPKLTKAIPSSLIAIIIMTVIAVAMSRNGIHLQNVQDFAGMEISGGFPRFHLPMVPINLETLRIIFPYAVIGGLVGLAEAVLTLQVIDEMTNTRGRTNKEIVAQGIANLVNGFFGGMGGDAMIGQSIINIKSGGRSRISGLVAASALMFFIMFGSAFINAIPLAGLVGVMFMVVIGTFKWESLRYKNKVPAQDILVIVVVSLITIFADLATAVIVGVVVSALIFAWEKGKVIYANVEETEAGEKMYKINGTIFFGSVLNFKDIFDFDNDPDDVVLDLKYAKVSDYSAVEAISSITKRYAEQGKTFRIVRLSDDCKKLFRNADVLASVHIDDVDTDLIEFPYV
ncbi:sulfate permease, SulP family [Alkalibacterium putridalgicola]|uniref:Sodium-independent anion transporter n=1 Tax=Alkalibacterium putridalgicola TaxID=426703 RepID=A0A1H7VZV7_9LACT|nr:SulP family inorganic anion transporter [Alkalibacterium putridalgicola]GEK88680.1 sodium-independent anion transporter [Alkalibacterium putridalgicola]SEM14766.1 sulfate permease, SulP family [Alkalibacterium putridalgicola]